MEANSKFSRELAGHKFKVALSGLRQFLVSESLLKMMEMFFISS